jgi:hypothetical protein
MMSDGCNYQNRNNVLGSALSDFAKSHNKVIEQLYLEKGHTIMEAETDRQRMHLARPSQPYKVNSTHYDCFKKYDDLKTNLSSLRPAMKIGDSAVVDIRGLKYLPSGDILFKLNYSEEWQTLSQRRKLCPIVESPALYTEPLSISESKYKHLQELKDVIDRNHRIFYDTLIYKPDKKQ